MIPAFKQKKQAWAPNEAAAPVVLRKLERAIISTKQKMSNNLSKNRRKSIF
ncbi:hypothetical protein CTW3_01750 [Chlamydia trachomatis C/TW-3]|nr:hypothetical protein CTW3_01750 [Chlamydia trachomatis C/TW-3]